MKRLNGKVVIDDEDIDELMLLITEIPRSIYEIYMFQRIFRISLEISVLIFHTSTYQI